MSSVEAPTTPAVSNRERFRLELSPCQEWFTAYWASFLVLDIPATFCPRSLGALIWKTSNTVFTVTCLVYNWIDTDTPSFYLAYWSHLTLLLNALYTILSCCNTYFPVPQPGSDHRLGWRLKLTWAIFVLVSHASVVVTIFYWIAVWSPGEPVAFPNLTTHGVTMVTCLVDGLLVNRIPLKIHHWICLIVPYDLTYLILQTGLVVLDPGLPLHPGDEGGFVFGHAQVGIAFAASSAATERRLEQLEEEQFLKNWLRTYELTTTFYFCAYFLMCRQGVAILPHVDNSPVFYSYKYDVR